LHTSWLGLSLLLTLDALDQHRAHRWRQLPPIWKLVAAQNLLQLRLADLPPLLLLLLLLRLLLQAESICDTLSSQRYQSRLKNLRKRIQLSGTLW
jgi:hypothetical protein